jgi:predicted amidohydrolase
VQPLRIALVQLSPRLGDLEANLAQHRERLAAARSAGAGLVVFPELGLTGYQLQDLAAEVAMRIDDPRLLDLAAETGGLSAVVSFVEEADDHRLFISAALLEDGAIRFVHRKLFLPTYGLFDERRFFAAGDRLRTVESRLGIKLGLAVCEDFWHLAVPETLALDGAQLLINVSSSPGRDLAAIHEVGLGTAVSWRTLMRTYAQLTTSFVVFCNRVGMDETISFWGGSEVIAPSRSSRLRSSTKGCTPWTSNSAMCGVSGSACRCCATNVLSFTCGSCAEFWPRGPVWTWTRPASRSTVHPRHLGPTARPVARKAARPASNGRGDELRPGL